MLRKTLRFFFGPIVAFVYIGGGAIFASMTLLFGFDKVVPYAIDYTSKHPGFPMDIFPLFILDAVVLAPVLILVSFAVRSYGVFKYARDLRLRKAANG